MRACLLLRVLGEDVLFGHDAEDEGVLAVRELVRPLRVLPGVVLLHQVHVICGRGDSMSEILLHGLRQFVLWTWTL